MSNDVTVQLERIAGRVLDEMELSIMDAGIEPDEIDRQLNAMADKFRVEVERRQAKVRHVEPQEVA